MNQDLTDILRQTRKLLELHDHLGIRLYPATEALGQKSVSGRQRPTVSKPAPPESPPVTAPPPAAGRAQLPEIQQDIADCQLCSLAGQRSHIVFGAGNPTAELMIIGGWPNPEEDREGECYQGAAGQLLLKMLAAMQIKPEEVYFTTLVKCCPAAPEQLSAVEISACLPFLLRQIEAISPRVIWALGPEAAQKLLQSKSSILQLRGRFHDLNGIPLAATFHPRMMLQNDALKKPTWLDMQMIQKKLASSRAENRQPRKTRSP